MSRYYYGTYYGNITKNGYIAIPLPLAAIIRENNYPDKLHVIAVNQTYYPVPVIKLYNVISVSDPDINRTIDDISFMDKTHVVRIPQVESLEYCGIVQLSKKYKVRIPKRAMALAAFQLKMKSQYSGCLIIWRYAEEICGWNLGRNGKILETTIYSTIYWISLGYRSGEVLKEAKVDELPLMQFFPCICYLPAAVISFFQCVLTESHLISAATATRGRRRFARLPLQWFPIHHG